MKTYCHTFPPLDLLHFLLLLISITNSYLAAPTVLPLLLYFLYSIYLLQSILQNCLLFLLSNLSVVSDQQIWMEIKIVKI